MQAVHNIDVSVVLAVKNEAKYVREALVSILEQDGVTFEVIVVDDHSSDETFKIVSVLQRENDRLRLLSNPRFGKVSGFNTGVDAANGKFVCLFAGDDVMPEKSLAARWNVVKNLPEEQPVAGLCKILSISKNPKFDGILIPRKKGRGNMTGSSPLMNRKMVAKLFPVPECLPNEDTWLECGLSFFPSLLIKHSDIICCYWRVHENNSYNMTLDFDEYKKRITERLYAFELFYEKYKHELSTEMMHRLQARLKCNEKYIKSDALGVIFSGVNLRNVLRTLSIINKPMYNLRRQGFRVFSGW
jgi:glycosyltransferase involved in cell wall biosynthesis